MISGRLPHRHRASRRRALARLATVLGSAVLLAGCGQKGPLYLPDQPDPARRKKQKTTSG